ncbi:hypothetical protein CAPTEDRAFT_111465 [Capitella teleta]|uniref:Bromo domain-containing protein n=1 Tax=Capitella teleta TaxID=283909 RepID=R7U567_CAPTE|nr:hypothetical protein CAPTEDRAFT_111465 [Capitella teleta]|eukprot:ELU01500.1 hypothetical protein CAPTEDRAFT_111465 [Capitella teleta]
MECVKNHKEAWSFQDPVEEEMAPGYYEVIDEPMCLGMMEEKLNNFEYHRVQEFVNDFMLIVNNCRDFNGKDNGQSDWIVVWSVH